MGHHKADHSSAPPGVPHLQDDAGNGHRVLLSLSLSLWPLAPGPAGSLDLPWGLREWLVDLSQPEMKGTVGPGQHSFSCSWFSLGS